MPLAPAFVTDRQRLARAGQCPGSPAAAPVTDRQRLMRPVATHPLFNPLVVSNNTFVIRGKDDTYLGVSFGDGH